MARLASAGVRTSDSTKIGMTDDWNAELEEDIADLIGVALDHTISSPIFASQSVSDEATANSSTGQVNADGSISGVLRLLSTSSSAAAAAGIEFQTTNDDRFKLCATSSELELYEYDPDTDVWNLIGTISTGLGTFLALEDVFVGEDPKTYSGKRGEFLKVNDDEDGIDTTTITPATAVDYLEDVGDVPAYPATPHDDMYLKLQGADNTFEWVTSDPGAGAQIISELDDVADDVIPAEATRQGVLEIMNDGTYGIPDWKVVSQPLQWGYAVSIGLDEEPDKLVISQTDPERWKIYDQWKYVYFSSLSDDGTPGNETGDFFWGGVTGDDHCYITLPFPGIYEITVVVGIQPYGDWPSFLMFAAEVLYDPDNALAIHNPYAYFGNIWYWNVVEGQFKMYHFPGSYLVRSHTFTVMRKYSENAAQIAIKMKTAQDNIIPTFIATNHKINVLVKRLH